MDIRGGGMTLLKRILSFSIFLVFCFACGTGGDVVRVTTISDGKIKGLGEKELARLEEIKAEAKKRELENPSLKRVIQATKNYSVEEYLAMYPEADNPRALDYKVGGYDVLDIVVYEEKDLSREDLRVSADGYLSFALIGRVKVDGITTSEIEKLISNKLAAGQFILDAHVSVFVKEYKSKQFMVLGAVKEPGSYPLQAEERVLDGISRAEGIDFDRVGKQGMIIRTKNPNTENEKKIVIRLDIAGLVKEGDQRSNLLLADKDLIYIPTADFYYIIGQVREPGKYPYQEKEITLVEAISTAGGFTPIAARNRTHIIRLEDGVEKIIEIKVDAITRAGKKLHDIKIYPGDVIVVPESFF